jgi:ATP-dependent helicase/nuclease subunit A
MGYTINQEKAIHTNGTNILVSASAGSGKTGVLKERVIQKLKDGVDIDQLIVLTFTEAAASEMKSRIVKEINKEKLTAQIEKIDNAIISTFDAFTLRLVKEYHYLLGLDNDIDIADAIIVKARKQTIIEEVIKKYYLRNESDFNIFVKRYFSGSDKWLYDAIYDLGEALRKTPDFMQLLENYDELYLTDSFIDNRVKEYILSLQDKILQLYDDFYLRYIDNAGGVLSDYRDYYESVNRYLNYLKVEINPRKLFNYLKSCALPVKPRKSECEKPEIIILIENIRKEFTSMFVEDYDDFKLNFQTSVPAISLIKKMVEEYLREYEICKFKEKLFSFEDIMYLAIKLFKDFKDVRTKFTKTIKEILVDEYQDTNDLQDEFISLLANDNVFMVGDVKQSIYRFRDANPKNFMRIYEEYSKNNGGIAIFLQENFRSNRFVLNSINRIFEKVMTNNQGGVDYRGEQVLISGFADDFPLHEKEALDIRLYELEKIAEDYPNLNKPEIEAHLLAQDILEKIKENTLIYDMNTKVQRELKFSDFTILVAHKGDFLKTAQIISEYNIPIDVYDDEPFTASDEINFLFQYLQLINCFKDSESFKSDFKTSLYSVARSFVYKIKDQEISKFFINEKCESIEDLKKLNNYPSLKKIYDDITYIHLNCWDLPIYNLVESIYDLTNIYRKIADLDNPQNKEEKLDFFLMKVKSFKGYTFKDLIEYIKLVIDSEDLDIQYSQEKKSVNAVKLMSMHKSKGLQFPVVYLIGLYKKFINKENKSPFIFNKDYGILTKSYENGFYPNFLQRLFFNTVDRENLSERIRLLYVAMTRAINRLVLISDYDEKLIEKNKTDFSSFKDIIYRTHGISYDLVKELVIDEKTIHQPKLDIGEELLKFDSFNFKQEKLEKIGYSKKMTVLLADEVKSVVELGTKYHELLEKIDYHNVQNSIVNFPAKLKKSIEHLSETIVMKELKNPEFFQEYEFYQENDELTYRGVIDLLIIDEDKVICLDFKLKNIDDSAYELQLRGYHNYLHDKLHKPIKLFLYSLMDCRLKEIVL